MSITTRLATSLILLAASANCQAISVVGDIYGVITDPLKLGSAGDSATAATNRAIEAILTLQKNNDANVMKYIAELRGLIDKINDAVTKQRQDLLTESILAVEKMADRLDTSIKLFFATAECSAKVIVADALKTAFGNNFRFISKDNVEVTLPFEKTTTRFFGLFTKTERETVEIDLSKIESPSEIYEVIRNRYISNLTNIKEDSKANTLVSAYADMGRFAKQAYCFYRDDGYGKHLIQEYSRHEYMVHMWSAVDYR